MVVHRYPWPAILVYVRHTILHVELGKSMDEETSEFQTLIQQAREGDQQALGHLLDNHRDFLVRLANQQIGEKLRARVDGSDVVQMTFLQAVRAIEDFHGSERGEFVAWLKQILSRNVSVAVRDHAVLQKRALKKERRLDDSRNSGPALRQALSAEQSTPSAKAIRTEEASHLLQLLDQLPEDQRTAVRLRHCEDWTLAELAEHLGRSKMATAGLVKRGMRRLRSLLDGDG